MENIRAAINAKEVYENGLTGKGIGIAVLDTGASMHHEIAENISYFKDFVHVAVMLWKKVMLDALKTKEIKLLMHFTKQQTLNHLK